MDMLNNEVSEKLDLVIRCITDSLEYKKCIDIKKQMKSNELLLSKIEEVKKLQKKYIRTNSREVKEELDNKLLELNSIPIYVEYNNYLELVNEKINIVKEELNNYFNNKLNKIDF